MKNRKTFRISLVVMALFFIHTNAFSQGFFIDPTSGDVTMEFLGCDNKTHLITIRGISYDEPYFTFSVTIDSRSSTFTVDIINWYFDETTGQVVGEGWQAYIDFFLEGLGCTFSEAVAYQDVAAPSDPVVAQSIQSFKSVAFSERARPKAAGKRAKKTKEAREEEERKREAEEREEEPTVPFKPNEVSSDIERESFSINKLDGTNFAIRGGYAKTSDNGVLTYGGNYILNNLSFEDADDALKNSTINLCGNMILLETDTRERSVGASFNFLLFDEDYSDDNGYAVAAYGVERLYSGDNILVYGAMFQLAKIGDLTSTYAMLAGMYGFPVGERFSLNIDGMFVRNLSMSYDGESIDLDSKNLLDVGANLSIFMSEAFGLTVGFKKVFLVEDYSNFVFTLGGGFRF